MALAQAGLMARADPSPTTDFTPTIQLFIPLVTPAPPSSGVVGKVLFPSGSLTTMLLGCGDGIPSAQCPWPTSLPLTYGPSMVSWVSGDTISLSTISCTLSGTTSASCEQDVSRRYDGIDFWGTSTSQSMVPVTVVYGADKLNPTTSTPSASSASSASPVASVSSGSAAASANAAQTSSGAASTGGSGAKSITAGASASGSASSSASKALAAGRPINTGVVSLGGAFAALALAAVAL